MYDSLASLLTPAILGLGAYGLGRPLLGRLRVDQEGRLERGVWSVAIGLVVAAWALAALALLGLLNPVLIAILSLAASAWGAARLALGNRHSGRERTSPGLLWRHGPGEPGRGPGDDPPPWIARVAAIAAGLVCLGSLVSALAPPTAAEAYPHLHLAKSMLLDGGLGGWSGDVTRPPPGVVHLWYLWALALDGPVGARLVQWGLGVLLAIAAAVAAAPILGRRWAWLAGVVTVLVPGVHGGMAGPSVGVVLGLATTLALAAWRRGAIDGGRRGWLAVAGLMAGAALATDPLALVFLPAMAASAGWVWLRQPRRRAALVRDTLAVLALAAVAGGPWCAAALIHGAAGQPLPDRGDLAAAGGPEYQLGALLPAALPGVLITRRLRGLGMLLAVAVLYGAGWHLLGAGGALLVPLVPLLAVAAVWVWIETRRFPAGARHVTRTALAGLLLLAAAEGIVRCRGQLSVACLQESRRQYLARHDPAWPAAELANEVFPPGARLLSEEPHTFYFPCRASRAEVYRQQSGYDRRLGRPADLARVLREAGFTHLLLAEDLDGQPGRVEPTLSRLVDAHWAAGDGRSLTKLMEYSVEAPDGRLRRYRLVMVGKDEG